MITNTKNIQNRYVDIEALEPARQRRLLQILSFYVGKDLHPSLEEGFRRNGVWTFYWVGDVFPSVQISQEDLNAIGKQIDADGVPTKPVKSQPFNSQTALGLLMHRVNTHWGNFVGMSKSTQFSNCFRLDINWFKQVGFYAQQSDLTRFASIHCELLGYPDHTLRISIPAMVSGSDKDEVFRLKTWDELEVMADCLIKCIGVLLKAYAKKANENTKHDPDFKTNLKIAEYYLVEQ